MYLAIRTDSPTAQLRLVEAGGKIGVSEDWFADRRLAQELLAHIEQLLQQGGTQFTDLGGLVVFKGPGSFTGLRIGATVMNTLAGSLELPIVGTSGDDWLETGRSRLNNGENDQIVLPEYGAEARITAPKK